MAFMNKRNMSHYGRGMGRGSGFGRRGGSGNFFQSNSMSFHQMKPLKESPQHMTKEQQIENLRQQSELLKNQLDTLLEHIKELSDEHYQKTTTRQYVKAFINESRCIGCGNCQRVCPQGAITLINRKAEVDPSICTGCGLCIMQCPRNAISLREAS
jgi:NAD-dependent dihydropyrimidine dehydrogenase PreA subunit